MSLGRQSRQANRKHGFGFVRSHRYVAAVGDRNLAGNIQSEAKASIVFGLVADFFPPREGAKNMMQGRSLNHLPTIVDAKFHFLRRPNYHHSHWSVARSVFEGI